MCTGSRDAISITVASAEGPAMDGTGQRNQERLAAARIAEHTVRVREDHAQRDEEENDAARYRQRLVGQLQPLHERPSAGHECDQDHVGEEALAQDDLGPPGRGHLAQHRHDDRQVAEGVEDQDEQDRSRRRGRRSWAIKGALRRFG
jgi:hypothetical protein